MNFLNFFFLLSFNMVLLLNLKYFLFFIECWKAPVPHWNTFIFSVLRKFKLWLNVPVVIELEWISSHFKINFISLWWIINYCFFKSNISQELFSYLIVLIFNCNSKCATWLEADGFIFLEYDIILFGNDITNFLL